MLPDERKIRVRAGFARLKRDPDQMTRDFYARLFRRAPELRPLFREDITLQATKLSKMLALVVHTLDNLGALVPAMKDLGARHVEYGVVEEHYAIVGDTLLDTLGDHVRDWTPEDRAAWNALFRIASDAMMAGARDAAARPRSAAG